MADLVFDLSPTQSDFVHTDAHIAQLIGPMGEGKTYAGGAGIVRHAVRCNRNIRGALIRDTHTNIKISTVPDLKEVFGPYVSFHDDDRKMVIHSTPKVEMDLFGIDDPAALSKLQGPQYAIIWLEEPAPIIEKCNAGLPRDVLDMSIARAARQSGTQLRVQITHNPADEDHWTESLANEPEVYASDPDTGLEIIKKVFRIPYGENKRLTPLARVANRAAFKNDPGKFARYVEGRAAPVQKGKSVTPEYNPKIHFSDKVLPVIPGAPGIRGWDSWHHPCCGIMQLVPPGKLWVHDVIWDEGVAAKQLIEQKVMPMLSTPKYKNKIHDWREIGDPTMRTPDQSNHNQSAAKVVESYFKTRFEAGPVQWAKRIDPTKTALSTLAADGSPLITISSSAYILHRALNGGWHWKKDNSGNRVGNVPVKDKFGDIGDMFTYVVSCVFPYARPKIHTNAANPDSGFSTRNRRAMSYAPSRPFSSPPAAGGM